MKIIMVHRYDIFTNTIAQKTTAHSVSHRHFDETSKKWIERKQRYHNNNNNNKWMLRLHKKIQKFNEFYVGFNGDFLILFKYFNKRNNLVVFKHFKKWMAEMNEWKYNLLNDDDDDGFFETYLSKFGNTYKYAPNFLSVRSRNRLFTQWFRYYLSFLGM